MAQHLDVNASPSPRRPRRRLPPPLVFLGEVAGGFFPPYARGGLYYQQFVDIGLRSIPIVLVVGLFVGMVLSVMTYPQFAKLGTESLVGPFVAVPMVKQLGPVMTALMVLCRVGSATTAELGSMRVTEQIDALSSFGVDPVRHLVVPRVVLCGLMLPALTVFSNAIGIVGGWFVSVHIYGISAYHYWQQTAKYFVAYDIYAGMAKACCFGLVIGLTCAYKGYHTRGGATGIGRSIMEGVVAAFVLIIVSNFFISLATTKIWQFLYA